MTAKGASWSWRAENGSGEIVETAATGRTFASQSDAESWLGESWVELADDGAEQVVLLRDQDVVYGPMSLEM